MKVRQRNRDKTSGTREANGDLVMVDGNPHYVLPFSGAKVGSNPVNVQLPVHAQSSWVRGSRKSFRWPNPACPAGDVHACVSVLLEAP